MVNIYTTSNERIHKPGQIRVGNQFLKLRQTYLVNCTRDFIRFRNQQVLQTTFVIRIGNIVGGTDQKRILLV